MNVSESSYPNSDQIIELGDELNISNTDMSESSSGKCMVDVSTQASLNVVTIPLQEITINVETSQEEDCESADTELYYQETSFIETRSGNRYKMFN